MPEAKDDLLSTDRAVLDGYRRGERSASLQVFRFYVDDVHRWVRQGVWVHAEGQRTLVGAVLDAVDIEEVVQDVFLRVFRPAAREGYDGVRPFRGYLLSITRNVLIDAARKRKVQTKASAKISWSPDAEPLSPEENAGQQQLRDALASLKQDASDEERRVWTLRFEEGLSLRAVAAQLQLGMHRVRRVESLLRDRVLRMLRTSGHIDLPTGASSGHSVSDPKTSDAAAQNPHNARSETYEET